MFLCQKLFAEPRRLIFYIDISGRTSIYAALPVLVIIHQSFSEVIPHSAFAPQFAFFAFFLHQPPIIMPKPPGSRSLNTAERGYILGLHEISNISNYEVASKANCDEGTVRNILKRASEAEKENINPLTSSHLNNKPKSGRPSTLTIRDERRLARYATANRANRWKLWLKIARELGYTQAASTINRAFQRAGYGRYPPRYKPPLTPEIKQKRVEFVDTWESILQGKEHIIVYCDETSVRVGETRG